MPVFSSRAIYGAAYQVDATLNNGQSSGPGDGFVLDSGSNWRQFNQAGMGTVTKNGVGLASSAYFLVMGGENTSNVKLNAGNLIPEGTLVEVSFWAIRCSAGNRTEPNTLTILPAGSGIKENKMEDGEFINLQESSTANGFQATGPSTDGITDVVASKWRKSTDNTGPADYTELSTNGRLLGSEIPLDNGFGSGGTMHHFKITFTVPSGGRYYRLSKSADGAEEQDHSFHIDTQVIMTPAVITPEAAASADRRTVFSNESKPSHASVSLGSDTTAEDGLHNPFDEDFGGNPAVLSSSGVTFTASNGRLTVPDDGMYEITVVGHIRNTSDGDGLSRFDLVTQVTTSDEKTLIATSPDIPTANQRQASYVLHGIFRLNANDTVTVLVNTTNSSGTVVLEKSSTFSIHRIS